MGRREGTRGYTAGELRGIDRALARALDNRAAAKTRRVLAIRVPVHAHVIDGPRYRGPSKAKVLAQFAILNRAFSGRQSPVSAPAGVSFVLRSFQRVSNRGWLEAAPGSTGDRTMRRRLHRGGKASLNAYFAAPPGGFLGSSSFPWDVARRPAQDGVTIHNETMTGGRFRGYNQGDTAVHEVGHWLGLLHTFQGACSVGNDRVADTPAELEASFECEIGRDTCVAEGLDPVRNFMDYSFDSCMDTFTAGQVARVAENWLAFRTLGGAARPG